MNKNIEFIYDNVIKNLNENEKQHSEYLVYTKNGFIKYQKYFNKKNLSLNIKLMENRKHEFIKILDDLSIVYKILNENMYFMMFELEENCNYIIIEFVVNSHVTIPKSFLKHFGYRAKAPNGIVVDYININNMRIESKKIKDYGAVYGYYSKYIEKVLSNRFETKISMISKEINLFGNRKISNMNFTKNMLEDIYNFFDITTYRNPKILKELNEQSLSSVLVGGYSHDNWLKLAISRKFPHIYYDLKFNIIINKTNRDFVINDTMISSIMCDKKNEVIILPINKKECIALMKEDYYKKFFINGKLHFMNIENDTEVEMINRYIYKNAKLNKENIIGSKKELEILLSYVN